MAEYRALAQNTIKLSTEMTLHHNLELGAPLVHSHPRVKVIAPDRSSVYYASLVPSSIKSSTLETYAGNIFLDATSSSQINNIWAPYGFYYTPIYTCIVSVDGVAYHGVKSAYFCGTPDFRYAVAKGGTATFPAKGFFPQCYVKTVVYSAAGKTLVINETTSPAAISEDKTISLTSMYAYGVEFAGLRVKKEENDVVLAIEIEYPKHDITLNTSFSGLQYSLDDGLTFTDVTDGTTLEQIEHVVFKNTSDLVINVGTKNGDLDVASISAGATYVAVPEADGTWYVS